MVENDNQARKAKVFNELASSLDTYAWVTANKLKEKFGTIDDEEEYKKIEEEVIEYSKSSYFLDEVKKEEVTILNTIVGLVEAELKVLNELK